MVALVFPVGHFAGPMFVTPDAEIPASFEVRFRDGVFSLSAQEYAVWAVSHGDPAKMGGAEGNKPARRQNPSRAVVESAAKAAGIEEPAPLFESLIDDGLLVQVLPKGEAAREFARTHQVMPLALGLGNSAENLGQFQIGMPNAPRATVGYDVYHMWLFCHREKTLWEAVSTIAKEAEVANAEEAASDREDKVELISDPDVLLTGFLEALPVLVSTSCVYIDRR